MMQLALTEDQRLLLRTATDFVQKSAPMSRLRKLRDARDALGYSKEAWTSMAELGFFAIPFTESDGGVGLGSLELVLLTEALGRGLSPEPLVPSIVLAGRLMASLGTSAQKAEWLTPAIAGEKILAVADTRPRARFDPTFAPVTAERKGNGFVLSGQASQVWGGHLADGYLVLARTSGKDGDPRGLSLFLVSANARGLRSERPLGSPSFPEVRARTR